MKEDSEGMRNIGACNNSKVLSFKCKKADEREYKKCENNCSDSKTDDCKYLRNTEIRIGEIIFDFRKFAFIADFVSTHFNKNLKNSTGDFPTLEKSSR